MFEKHLQGVTIIEMFQTARRANESLRAARCGTGLVPFGAECELRGLVHRDGECEEGGGAPDVEEQDVVSASRQADEQCVSEMAAGNRPEAEFFGNCGELLATEGEDWVVMYVGYGVGEGGGEKADVESVLCTSGERVGIEEGDESGPVYGFVC